MNTGLSRPAPLPSLAPLRGRSVIVTGHTGFKGSWLCLWLDRLGARVTGYALPAEPDGLFERAAVRETLVAHIEADVRDAATLDAVVGRCRPEFVFHLAAQSLVRASYDRPIETFGVNTMGTANLLEAVRKAARPAGTTCSVVCVTTDKCYRNDEHGQPMREEDPLGGRDPYSASKAAAELIVQSYRDSFFPTDRLDAHGVRLASARAGNVLGGGDFAADRIVPDLVRALQAGEPVRLRNPASVRPWQHVLDPLHGYLQLAAALAGDAPTPRCTAFNFGPEANGCTTVQALVERLLAAFGDGSSGAAPAGFVLDDPGTPAPHEARLLRLAIDKARELLAWRPVWDVATTARRTAAWYARVAADPDAARAACEDDLAQFARAATA